MDRINCPACDTNNSKIAKYCSGCGVALPKPEVADLQVTEPKKPKEKILTTKKIASFAIGIVAFIIAYGGAQYLFSGPSFDKKMMMVANDLNESLPLMVDSITRLDHVAAMPNKTFRYNYTLVDISKDDLDVDKFREIMEPIILNIVKTQPDMKMLRDNGANFSYNYKDKESVFLVDILISPEDYQDK